MLVRGDGWEVQIRNVVSGENSWRPIVFFLAITSVNKMGQVISMVQICYLKDTGELGTADVNNKLRQVGS